jgi:alkanesulfonate monooxygenase SsuD/methylene tetrahydromethanopterin reductase-like flavin-dependent oxidoreductase (luciferase family)
MGQRRKDALIGDREKGIFADPAKVHRIDHRGRYFNVRGPLPALPSPQQRPVIIQAGLSVPAWTWRPPMPTCSSARAARLPP